MLQAFFDAEGVLNVKPRNHHEAMMLKWFVKEFAVHGARLLNIETEVSEGGSGQGNSEYQYGESAYGFADRRPEEGYGNEPQGAYDSIVRNIRDYRGDTRSERGGSRGGRNEGDYFNPQGTRDRNPFNGR